MKTLLLALTCASFATSAFAALVEKELTFDDLTPPGTDGIVIPNGYAGVKLNWSNFGVLDGTLRTDGYLAGTVSPKNVAFNGNSSLASISADAGFSLKSVYLTAGSGDLLVRVDGYIDGILCYEDYVMLSSTTPTFFAPNYWVTQLDFFPLDINGSFAMDNLLVEAEAVPVEEPPADADLDGIPDGLDQCPGTVAGAVVDANGCSIEQLAPCAGTWRNHGEYVNAVKAAANQFLAAGLITVEQRDAIATAAAQSNCGKTDETATAAAKPVTTKPTKKAKKK